MRSRTERLVALEKLIRRAANRADYREELRLHLRWGHVVAALADVSEATR